MVLPHSQLRSLPRRQNAAGFIYLREDPGVVVELEFGHTTRITASGTNSTFLDSVRSGTFTGDCSLEPGPQASHRPTIYRVRSRFLGNQHAFSWHEPSAEHANGTLGEVQNLNSFSLANNSRLEGNDSDKSQPAFFLPTGMLTGPSNTPVMATARIESAAGGLVRYTPLTGEPVSQNVERNRQPDQTDLKGLVSDCKEEGSSSNKNRTHQRRSEAPIPHHKSSAPVSFVQTQAYHTESFMTPSDHQRQPPFSRWLASESTSTGTLGSFADPFNDDQTRSQQAYRGPLQHSDSLTIASLPHLPVSRSEMHHCGPKLERRECASPATSLTARGGDIAAGQARSLDPRINTYANAYVASNLMGPSGGTVLEQQPPHAQPIRLHASLHPLSGQSDGFSRRRLTDEIEVEPKIKARKGKVKEKRYGFRKTTVFADTVENSPSIDMEPLNRDHELQQRISMGRTVAEVTGFREQLTNSTHSVSAEQHYAPMRERAEQETLGGSMKNARRGRQRAGNHSRTCYRCRQRGHEAVDCRNERINL